MNEIEKLNDTIELQRKEIEGLKKHRDEKEVMVQAFNKICNLFNGYKWIMEGRGPYAYDDNGYKMEVTHLFTEFQFIRQDTWDNIQSRTAEYKHALLKDANDYAIQMLNIKIEGRDQTIRIQVRDISALKLQIDGLVEGLKVLKNFVPIEFKDTRANIEALIHKHTKSE